MTRRQRRFWLRLRNKMLPPWLQHVLGMTLCLVAVPGVVWSVSIIMGIKQ